MSGGWAGEHKTELLTAAAIAALAVSGGAAAPAAGGLLAGAGEGAAAGGLGAGFGADAAIGAGMGGSAASAFGPTAAQTMVGGLADATTAATPMITGGEGLGSGGLLGMPQLATEAGGAQPGVFARLQGGVTNLVGGPDNYDRLARGVGGFGKASNAMQAAGLLGNRQPQMQAPQHMPQAGQQMPAPGVSSFMQMYGKPVLDPETERRRKREQQMANDAYIRSNAGGGYGG